MTLLLAFLFGVVFGSFLNVLVDRLSTERSFIKGRSYCEHCKKTLQTRDLIPLISYLWLKGKCRFCKARIPLRLFIVELTSGLLFVYLSLSVTSSPALLMPTLFLGIILWSCLGIFTADITYGIIPDLLVLLATFASIFYLGTTHTPIVPHLISGVITLIFFLTLFVITRGRGMGFGDVKLSFMIGFLLGFPLIIVALYAAFLTGALVSIILVIWKKVRFFGGTIPFGPFLVGGLILSLFWGTTILQTFIAHFMQ